MGSPTETFKLRRIMSILAITLIFIMPAVITGLPKDSDSSCSSQTCLDCIGSCSSCDMCPLCALCLGLQCVSQCKYCKEGAVGCKKTCNSGKENPVCKKCTETCNRDIVFYSPMEEAQIEGKNANEVNEKE